MSKGKKLTLPAYKNNKQFLTAVRRRKYTLAQLMVLIDAHKGCEVMGDVLYKVINRRREKAFKDLKKQSHKFTTTIFDLCRRLCVEYYTRRHDEDNESMTVIYDAFMDAGILGTTSTTC